MLTLRLKNWRIVEAAEAGKLLWCFDVSATGRRRELRFWLAELGAVARGGWGAFGRLTPPEALNAIVGREAMAVLRVGTVTDIVAVERATVHEWMAAGRLTEAPTQYQAAWVTRASLVQFLAERWQGKGV